jgi:hypothetical protein
VLLFAEGCLPRAPVVRPAPVAPQEVHFSIEPTKLEPPVTSSRRVALPSRTIVVVGEARVVEVFGMSTGRHDKSELASEASAVERFASVLRERGWSVVDEEMVSRTFDDWETAKELRLAAHGGRLLSEGVGRLATLMSAEAALLVHHVSSHFDELTTARFPSGRCTVLRFQPLVVQAQVELIRGSDGGSLWTGKQTVRGTDVARAALTGTYDADCELHLDSDEQLGCFDTSGAMCFKYVKPSDARVRDRALYRAAHVLAADLELAAFPADIARVDALVGGEPAIAVFDVQGGEQLFDAKLLDQLTEYLAARLTQSGYRVVPRVRVREMLQLSKAEGYRDCFDQACQVELGKAMAAQGSLATRLTRFDDVCALTSSLFDLKTETTLVGASATAKCNATSLLAAAERIADQLRHENSRTPGCSEPRSVARSTDAE